ncbi:spermidine/putrescine ABC transporter permease/substrate-binding protein [Williamsoniiplasma lucivorax]|uniref:Spermidine/putrescine ABC transporter permease n=1 Tax=Williamsoniiplasma lucivorax TaxID=209274 RepID=A0A2S5R9Y8_9MOLU|nr:spermidine/putrescine ABC transporter permease/substrate-binding protein [Williamsoniiplasma lucivorax]PPE04113.1 spermidine/putrescine ABC transporter permease [Williamsoniiplasma lucivorax]
MKKFFKSSYFAIVMAFIYVPVIIMIIFSFNDGDTTMVWNGFSAKWYSDFFQDSTFLKSIITSLFVAVISTVLSLLIGVSAAIGLGRTKKITQRKWFGVANIPLINADVVTAVSLMVVFLISGIQFGIFTLIMAHVSFNVPYVLITVMPRLRKIDPALLEAGRDLGAKPSQVLFKIILPILKPAIITAAAIAFAMSFDDFIISYFTGGDQTNVSTFIYTLKKMKPVVFAFGTILVGVIVITIVGWNAFSITKEQKLQKIEQLKKGIYKTKQLSKLQKEQAHLQMLINNNLVLTKTKKLNLWIKYFILKMHISIVSSWNYDKKITRLEWKRNKLKSEISREQRYYSRLKSATKKAQKLNKQLAQTTDVKRAAKLTIQIDKLNEKIEILKEEIEWIESRDQAQLEKAQEIALKIQKLKDDLKNEDKPSKKIIAWYHKKIKYLEEWKIEIEEGKNKYKLRMILEHLKEISERKYESIRLLTERMHVLKKLVFLESAVAAKIDEQILAETNAEQLEHLKAKKTQLLNDYNLFLTKKLSKVDLKIVGVMSKIQKEKTKLAPDYDEDVKHTKGFFARTWKIGLVSILGIASFTGLTVAYVMNNIYDLVVANWGDYIDRSLITDFEKRYDVKVNYQEFDSNETLYNKLYTFDYDVMVPSDYMVQKLVSENRLLKLSDKEWAEQINLENYFSPQDHITKETISQTLIDVMKKSPIEVQGQKQNITDYAVPYFWGEVIMLVNPTESNKKFLADRGIEYNPATGQITNPEQLSWHIFWEAVEADKRLVLNFDAKNLFMMAEEVRNQKANVESVEDVDANYKLLEKLLYKSNVSLNSDEIINKVGTGNFDFSMIYNGDALAGNKIYNGEDSEAETEQVSEDGKTHFIFGSPAKQHGPGKVEGSNIWSDNMVVSKTSKNKFLAIQFMNFIIEKYQDISASQGPTAPGTSAIDALIGPEGAYEKYKDLYIPSKNGEAFKYNRTLDDYLMDKFNELITGKIN